MKLRIGLLVLPLIFFAACHYSSNQELTEVFESYKVDRGDQITINLESGELVIYPSDEMSTIVHGQVSDPNSVEVVRRGEHLKIFVSNSKNVDQYQVMVPSGLRLKINSYSANTKIIDFSGDLDVRSTGGNVNMENFRGSAFIWLGRGNAAILDGFGDVVLIGEHGNISSNNFSGNLSMSTIMGSIEYIAPGRSNSIVNLESDHGPVSAFLPVDFHASINVSTTSGTVACNGLEFSMTIDGCVGNFGDGEGGVFIRTVSGRVEVSVLKSLGAD